jgi:hypothetical protein
VRQADQRRADDVALRLGTASRKSAPTSVRTMLKQVLGFSASARAASVAVHGSGCSIANWRMRSALLRRADRLARVAAGRRRVGMPGADACQEILHRE